MGKRLFLEAVLLTALMLAASGPTGGSAARAKPALTVPRVVPLTVRGWRFAAGERVRVTVQVPLVHRKTVTAGRRGGFTVIFRVPVAKCTSVLVAAKGNKGSRATATVPSYCVSG